jgi:PAS domain S-box-containing protein
VWKETLLQGLIALLPVFLLLVWYDRPQRTRYVPVFLGICCGLAMALHKQFPILTEHSFRIDFCTIPLLVGSLYGGPPVAAAMALVYGFIQFYQITEVWEFPFITMFIAAVFIPLLRYSVIFRQVSWKSKNRILLVLISILFFVFVTAIFIHYTEHSPGMLQGDIFSLLMYVFIYLCALAAGIHFAELGFERVRLQEELREMSRKYRGEMRKLQQFIDQAPLAVVFLEPDGKVSHINDSCLRLLHPLKRTEVVGRHYEPVARLLNVEAPPLIDRVRQGEERVAEMITLGGKTIYVVVSAVKATSGGWEDGILVIGHDVTELQQLKDEVGRMERLSLVGQMAASITHEIRNPMAVIRGFVQLLQERSAPDQHSYFRIVMGELDRANGIINDFLSLAQNRIVEKEPGSLHDLLTELMPLIWADANLRGQSVELYLCEEMEPLDLNSKEIKQLVLNLARNGMEAMGDRGVLRIETVNLADTIQLRVTDQGVGIPKAQLERLFEPFFSTKTNGTGLGLALCLSIMERHNGKIHVESEVGKGTLFIVSFCKPGVHAGKRIG